MKNMLVSAKSYTTKTYSIKVKLIINYILEPLLPKKFKTIGVTNISSPIVMVDQTFIKQKPSICSVCTTRGVKQPHNHRKS